MRTKKIIALTLLVLSVGMSGCKEEKTEVASPACSDAATASDSTKCPRQDGNITRSKPQNWSLDSENK